MSLKIAIQPDVVVHPNGQRQSFSEHWIESAHAHGVAAVTVDAFAPDALAQIADCDAFMWRYPSSAQPRLYARRLLQAVETGLRMPVFPSTRSAWFYEDKLGQEYFFRAAGIAHAATHILWTREAAEHFCRRASYPFVLKLAGGHQSSNVRLVATRAEALFYVRQLFGHGLVSLGYRPATRPRRWLRRLRAAGAVARGGNPYASTPEAELQHGYFHAQEFLPGNAWEISAIVIGDRAFACRRRIRAGDFRTRGSSGDMDFDPGAIGEDAIRLACAIARKLGVQTVAVDILRRAGAAVAIELTVNYASWVVHACPGHWRLEGDPASGRLQWQAGAVRAEDLILEDFLEAMRCSTRLSVRHAVAALSRGQST